MAGRSLSMREAPGSIPGRGRERGRRKREEEARVGEVLHEHLAFDLCSPPLGQGEGRSVSD
jgi:hypothetical protein